MFTLPTPLSITAVVRGKFVTKIDIRHAFLHLKAPPRWADRVVLHVPTGRRSVLRVTPQTLEFGLSHTPSVFHSVMQEALSLLPFEASTYLDDILIWGHTREECAHRFKMAVRLLENWGR